MNIWETLCLPVNWLTDIDTDTQRLCRKKTLVVLWYYVGPVKATDCAATSIRNVLFYNKLVVHQVGAMSFSITLVLIPSVISNIYNKPPPHSVNPLLCCVAVSKKKEEKGKNLLPITNSGKAATGKDKQRREKWEQPQIEGVNLCGWGKEKWSDTQSVHIKVVYGWLRWKIKLKWKITYRESVTTGYSRYLFRAGNISSCRGWV